jgi:hypothetical protein
MDKDQKRPSRNRSYREIGRSGQDIAVSVEELIVVIRAKDTNSWITTPQINYNLWSLTPQILTNLWSCDILMS